MSFINLVEKGINETVDSAWIKTCQALQMMRLIPACGMKLYALYQIYTFLFRFTLLFSIYLWFYRKMQLQFVDSFFFSGGGIKHRAI